MEFDDRFFHFSIDFFVERCLSDEGVGGGIVCEEEADGVVGLEMGIVCGDGERLVGNSES